MERKVCFFGGPSDNQGARAFIGGGRELRAETAQAALTGILNLVIGGRPASS